MATRGDFIGSVSAACLKYENSCIAAPSRTLGPMPIDRSAMVPSAAGVPLAPSGAMRAVSRTAA
jgi:hypothetical protein